MSNAGEHACEPPIGPNTPDAWECSECTRRWVRREPRDPETLLSWRKVTEGRIYARCPWCRLEGCWAFAGGAEVDGNQFTPPKGHTVRAAGDDSAHRADTCPVRTPESRLYDPRPPWTPEAPANWRDEMNRAAVALALSGWTWHDGDKVAIFSGTEAATTIEPSAFYISVDVERPGAGLKMHRTFVGEAAIEFFDDLMDETP